MEGCLSNDLECVLFMKTKMLNKDYKINQDEPHTEECGGKENWR